MAKKRSNGNGGDFKASLSRLEASINGPLGVLPQLSTLTSDMFSVKLIIAGGIDPATGKTVTGLSQKFDLHLEKHPTREEIEKVDKGLQDHVKSSSSVSKRQLWTAAGSIIAAVTAVIGVSLYLFDVLAKP